MTVLFPGNLSLGQAATAGGLVRYISRLTGYSADEIRRVYQRQCGCDPERDHEHLVKWLRGWCGTLDAVRR